MKVINNVQGSQKTIPPIEVNVDTVYVRTNVVRIETEDFTGWQYDEVQYPIREYMETLTREQDSGVLALIISMLMSEVDMLKSMIGGSL